jgi:phosphoribosylformylglycinamidine synthase
LPVRHGEGKLIPKNGDVLDDAKIALYYADENGNLNPPYPLNPNGSPDGIAGICDETGRIFGLMPHPEAYLYKTNHPRWVRGEAPAVGMGRKIFENAVWYVKQNII